MVVVEILKFAKELNLLELHQCLSFSICLRLSCLHCNLYECCSTLFESLTNVHTKNCVAEEQVDTNYYIPLN